MSRKTTNLAVTAGVAGACYLAARLGISLAFDGIGRWPIWPPTGVALGAMLILGYRVWPAVLLGAVLGNVAKPSIASAEPLTAILASLAVGIANTLEALMGAWLVQRFARGREAFEHPRTILYFVVLAGLVCTMISPSAVLWVFRLLGLVEMGNLGRLWLNWWLAGLVSAVAVTPVLLTWSKTDWRPLTAVRLGELTALMLVLLAVSGGVFGSFGAGRRIAMDFVVVPILLWAALRFGPRGASGAMLVLLCVATSETLHGHGPFVVSNRLASLLTLQAFITVMSVMAGMVAADALVRRRTETALVRSEQRYRELFERNPQPAFVCDRKSGSIVAANAAAMQVYGYSYTDLLSRKFSKLQVRQMAGRPGEPTSDALPPGPKQEEQHLRADGTVLDAEVTRYDLLLEQGPATVLVCADVTQKRRSQKRVKLFSDLGQRLSVARTQSNAAWIIVDTADRLFGWDACTFSLVGPQEGRVEIVLSADIIDGRRTELPPASEVPGPVIRKILTEGSQLLVRPASGEFPAEALPFGDVKRPSATIMGVPIRKEETVLGILTIQSYTHNAYSLEDLEVLQAVADHCAGALERIRAEEENERLNLELRRHLDQLQTLLAVAPVGIAVAQDPECRVVSGNETWCRLLGVKSPTDLSASTQGENVQPEMLKQGKTLPLEEWPIRRAARDQVSIIGEEVEVRLSNDRVASYYAYASPLFDETGKVRGCLSILVDLTERKRAEQEVLRLNAELERRVRERTLQLEVINKELEAFSYSVSHDLRAPLRSIRGFSEILLEKYGPQLDEGGREYLNRACASCVHMDKLIEDLLKLSRVGRSELQRQQVNLSRMAEEIGTELQRADPDRRVTLAVTPGLKVEGDERLLRVAMENLLRNAWKFTRDQPEPRVEFGVREGGERAFYVKDNGAGFNPAYAGKLFGVFQRLHTVSEFPGTGVGLATVQRVIVRHGGRTWATGQVKEGACFYFTLPTNRN